MRHYGLRVLIARGYAALEDITDDNLAQIPSGTRGQDVLDVALCGLGILLRTPQRGTSRRRRSTVAELVAIADIAEPFRAITLLYLEAYATRISHVYVTLRHKLIALGHFWRFLAQQYPDITRSADVLPAHGRAYIPYAIARARERQRGEDTGPELRSTAHVWLLEVRTFFADVCTWTTEPDSPFARRGSSASAAPTRSRNRVPRRSFVACSPAMSGRSGPRASAGRPRGRSPRDSLKSRGSSTHCDRPRNSHPMWPPRSKGKLDAPMQPGVVR